MAKTNYDLIKKQNGEQFAQDIRNYDNGIFDVPNIVDIVKYAGRNAKPILGYLESLKTRELKVDRETPAGDPFELLHRAGYRAEYADTLEKQNDIKKYFAPREELCTFRDIHRFENYYIINAVRYDVDKIRRADFKTPQREDEYGTSVMSIQMAKGGGFISIKNRYNHTVDNPDNTYGSNPDNIIYGLSAALMQYFDIEFYVPYGLPDGYVLVGNQVVKYNLEVNGVLFGRDLYVKKAEIVPIHKDHQVLIDNFVLDLATNTVTDIAGTTDSFPGVINAEIRGKKLSVTKPDADGTVHILADGVPLMGVRDGQLVDLHLPNVQVIPADFLRGNRTLESIDVSNAEEIGDNFLAHNRALKSIDVRKAKTIGDHFLFNNIQLQSIDVHSAEMIGNYFLYTNLALQSIDVHSAETIGNGFLRNNRALQQIIIPDDAKIGLRFLDSNKTYRRIAPVARSRQFKRAKKNIAARTMAVPQNTNDGMEY